MTKDDLKHAIISLCIGVLTTAGISIINGLAHLALQWLSGIAGGTAATTSYLIQKYNV